MADLAKKDIPLLATEQRLSIVHGPGDKPLLDLTLAGLLDFQCRKNGSKELLIIPWTQTRWTYDHLRQESIYLARSLIEHGIASGDRIAIMAGNCEQYVSVFFACMRVGAILVILNNTYTASEATYALSYTESKLLFITPWIGLHDNRPLLARLDQEPGTLQKIVVLNDCISKYTSYSSLIEKGYKLGDEELEERAQLISCHDVCNLQFTSGTTGHPKAAMLTHHGLVNNARFIGDRMGFTDEDVLCCPPPLFHCFGLVLGLLATLSHGGKIVYPSETFDAAACLRAITEEQCTALHGVPAMFDKIFSLPRPEDFDCYSLRTGIVAGAPVPKHLMKLMFEELGMTEYTSSYGLTEASPTCFNAFYNSNLDLKLNTVGYVMPHAHCKIVNSRGDIVPVGVPGELCMAGYQLQAGYWKNQAKTDEVMIRDEDGVLWLHTGDEAVMHSDGTVTITGRFKDIIIRGGENIYPLEIEERLLAHRAITKAIVVGVKDERYGEVVAAILEARPQVPRPTNSEVRKWVTLELGRHKAPAEVFWLGEDGLEREVPLTGSGKVRKFQLREKIEAVLRRVGTGIITKARL